MPPVTSQIPGEGTSSLLFAVPGNGLDIETVYVEVDTTAAAGAVTAELTIQDQSGVVIARKTQGATIPAGGTGSATWGLRLDDEGAGSSGGGVTCQYSQYTAGILSLAPAAVGNLELNAVSSGPALLDLTVPGTPTVIATGVYACQCDFRIVHIFGTPTSGQTSQYAINAPPGFQSGEATWLQPTAGGGFLPQVTAETIPLPMTAGDAVTFVCTNHDTTKTLRYDSPAIYVSLLS